MMPAMRRSWDALRRIAVHRLRPGTPSWRLARRLSWLVSGKPPMTPVGGVLAALAPRGRPKTFVQIGSNDAAHNDPLREFILMHGWRGIMVEPVPYVFDRLCRNYGHLRGLTFENVAIAEADGTRDFYYVRESAEAGLPPWYDQLGSFSLETVLKHAEQIPGLRDRVVHQPVACRTFASLTRQHGVGIFDVLQIDTEGYDYRILRQVDLARHRPSLILYEHRHLPSEDATACMRLLDAAGYECRRLESGDTICAHSGALQAPALKSAWRTFQEPSQENSSR